MKDVTNKYVQWINDQKVMKYSDQRLRKHTINDIIKYVNDIKKSRQLGANCVEIHTGKFCNFLNLY